MFVKRKNWNNFVRFESLACNPDNILATDWEIEERKIEITESEFDYACNIFAGRELGLELRELKKRLFG